MSVVAGLEGVWKYTGVGVMFCVGCGVSAVCPGVWRSAAAAASLGSGAAGALSVISVGVHI